MFQFANPAENNWYQRPFAPRATTALRVGIDGKTYKPGEFMPFYVPRPIMPQIDEADLPELLAFLKGRGIAIDQVQVAPEQLHAHQRVDFKKVHAGTTDPVLLAKPLLISADLFVLDGNHRFFMHKLIGTACPCLRIGLEFEAAIAALFEFPKTYALGDGKPHAIHN